ncbi:dTDP-4-dehydrorhamnose 3,5-epimerase family protein [Streptomyces sp. OfavH-34-F]|uniref:dTDP-4-dehydrorhamnose 3,5-epimerase family protein n=1 Tax=Streptomyces sp. OfavH-34-F TaxID=2917760 RepID=UPI001EF2B5FA|nr:dTDP-4-dehydrorhamnose 3,5-epimerase family protein [Streptomyces sp. OfavH-34-F]MCG7524899.1 dTDP-4-dehydrorhamnose 3,5-epimerase family protein [Streptomyces sp. OfavH-34-F]
MEVRALGIEGAWEIRPPRRTDPRGVFLEWYRADVLAGAVGHPLRLAQANLSVSARGVVRGVHYADVPPGQAKYVTCVRGACLDVVVDLRTGSPTYGRWEAVRLDDERRAAVYLAEGLGHAFCALEDDTTLSYMCSEPYRPAAEHAVHPLDPGLAIDWPVERPVLSERDRAAPTLERARASGALPEYAACRAYAAGLRIANSSAE